MADAALKNPPPLLRDNQVRRGTLLRRSLPCALSLLLACDTSTTSPPVSAPPPGETGELTVAGSFELLGGYRLDVDFPSEGLGLIRDSDGYIVGAVGGAHAHEHSVHVYDLHVAPNAGSDVSAYPLLMPVRTWKVSELFPSWISGQNLRDVTVVSTPNGYEIAGIGRVYYNTAPRGSTQINVREVIDGGATLAAARVIPVDLPEQEFSGFIKHDDPRDDLSAIGAGAYDSGQGSVAGLSYAVRTANGSWTRRLTPPAFGDLTSPRLPRDTSYSCPDGESWVCIPPKGGVGVWSTERIGGGGVRIGNHILFLPTLGYGPRSYARQSYTFGDPSMDQAVAYIFTQDSSQTGTPALHLARYERWTYANAGELVLGVAVGRVRNVPGRVLFVVTGNTWSRDGRYRASPVLQLFRVR